MIEAAAKYQAEHTPAAPVPPPPPPPPPPIAAPAAKSTFTVGAYLKSSDDGKLNAVRARWNGNATHPALGELVTAARRADIEPSTIADVAECVDRTVTNHKEIRKAYKTLGITDVDILREKTRTIDDAIDMCMTLLLAMAKAQAQDQADG